MNNKKGEKNSSTYFFKPIINLVSLVIFFSFSLSLAIASTPNPGHPAESIGPGVFEADIGGGNFSFINGRVRI